MSEPLDLGIIDPGTPVELLAYVERRNPTTSAKEPIQQAHLTPTTIPWKVYTVIGTTRTLVASGTFLITTVIFDTVQTLPTANVWEQGGPGFNFLAKITGTGWSPTTPFPEANRTYLIKVSYPFTGGDTYDDWFTVKTRNVPV